MSTVIELGSRAGIGDGYRRNLPLEHDLAEPIEVDARRLGPCHPMFPSGCGSSSTGTPPLDAW